MFVIFSDIKEVEFRPINMEDLVKAAEVMQRSKSSELPYLFPGSI